MVASAAQKYGHQVHAFAPDKHEASPPTSSEDPILFMFIAHPPLHRPSALFHPIKIKLSPKYIVLEVSIILDDQEHDDVCIALLDTMWTANYKVQLLAAKHIFGVQWQPNALITLDNIRSFFFDAKKKIKDDKQYGGVT